MEIELLKIGGPLALALVIIWFIVRAFLKEVSDQRDDFMLVITNHLKHDVELHEKVSDSINRLNEAQRENTSIMKTLMSFLKKNGTH